MADDRDFPMDNKDIPTEEVKKTVGIVPHVQKRMITWDEATGLPVPTEVPALEKPQLEALALTAMSLPYVIKPLPLEEDVSEGEWKRLKSEYIEEKKFDGMTNAEVMMIKMAKLAASGDAAVAEKLLDRVLGKPKQSSEIKTMKVTYEEYMDQLAKQENAAPNKFETIEEVEVITEPARQEPNREAAEGFGECDGLGEIL